MEVIWLRQHEGFKLVPGGCSVKKGTKSWASLTGWDFHIEVITDPPIDTKRIWLQCDLPDLEDPVLIVLDPDEARSISRGLVQAADAAEAIEGQM